MQNRLPIRLNSINVFKDFRFLFGEIRTEQLKNKKGVGCVATKDLCRFFLKSLKNHHKNLLNKKNFIKRRRKILEKISHRNMDLFLLLLYLPHASSAFYGFLFFFCCCCCCLLPIFWN